jgi:hypothetical protein
MAKTVVVKLEQDGREVRVSGADRAEEEAGDVIVRDQEGRVISRFTRGTYTR